jgi:NAD(P)H-flavin reductase
VLFKISPFSPAIKIVSIGGGTGISPLPSGLKHFIRSTDSKPALAIFAARMTVDRHQSPLPESASASAPT